ncbi:MAG: HDOD domain-containing protein [Phycisphaeraceae bacterium]|nr:HDOD domain-containing protein [Phycisphaeraceae bacterium]
MGAPAGGCVVLRALMDEGGLVARRRCELSAAEVDALGVELDRRVAGLCVQTQPQVVAKLLKLLADQNAGVGDFAAVIRSDPALVGRLLRVVNSPVFAQRGGVTTIERACVLLGLQRLRAIAISFYMSRSAGDARAELSRRIWGESIFRACLAAQLAPKCSAGAGAEAFIVSLLADVGVPLMPVLVGDAYSELLADDPSPTRLFQRENTCLEFTHVDVAAALGRSWRLPDLLAKPISRHHTTVSGRGAEVEHALHRVAFAVGSVHLRRGEVDLLDVSPDATRVLLIEQDALDALVRKTRAEYDAVLSVFADVADGVADLERLHEAVQAQLANAVEDIVVQEALSEARDRPLVLTIQDRCVEVAAHAGTDQAVAYVHDERGNRIVTYVFDPRRESADSVLNALGLDVAPGEAPPELAFYMSRLAA